MTEAAAYKSKIVKGRVMMLPIFDFLVLHIWQTLEHYFFFS